MVLQIATDTRLVENDGDAEAAQPLCRTNPGQLQNLCGTDRTGGQDDLAHGPDFDETVTLPVAHADGPHAFEQYFLDKHVRFEPEVRAMPNGPQKPAGGGPAKPALLIDAKI